VVRVDPGAMGQEEVVFFTAAMEARVGAGDLYDIVKSSYPGTVIIGLGNPGAGVDYTRPADESDSPVVQAEGSGESDEGELSGGAVFGFIAATLILAAIAVYAYSRRQNERTKTALQDSQGGRSFVPHSQPSRGSPATAPVTKEVKDDDSSAPSVWSDESGDDRVSGVIEDGEASATTPGSALAAVAAASTVTARIASPKSDPIYEEVKNEVWVLGDKLNPSKTADELRRMEYEPRVSELRDELGLRKSVAVILDRYAGREEELVGHLETMRSQRASPKRSEVVRTPSTSVSDVPENNLSVESRANSLEREPNANRKGEGAARTHEGAEGAG